MSPLVGLCRQPRAPAHWPKARGSPRPPSPSRARAGPVLPSYVFLLLPSPGHRAPGHACGRPWQPGPSTQWVEPCPAQWTGVSRFHRKVGCWAKQLCSLQTRVPSSSSATEALILLFLGGLVLCRSPLEQGSSFMGVGEDRERS